MSFLINGTQVLVPLWVVSLALIGFLSAACFVAVLTFWVIRAAIPRKFRGE
jgi:hypothetical protein